MNKIRCVCGYYYTVKEQLQRYVQVKRVGALFIVITNILKGKD
jgi:hypothetical protein